MTVLTEGKHTACYVVSEANNKRSREVVTLTGGSYAAGTVLGVVTESGKYTQLDQDAETGEEAAAAILLDNVDASTVDKQAVVHVRDMEYNADELTWPDDIDAGETTAAVGELTALGLISR